MRQRLRENALCASLACAGAAVMAWLGLYGFAWTDYDNEVRPAYDALVSGHVGRFLALAPAYGGSLIERAPFALLPGLWGGGSLAVYRMVALPCLLATVLLGVWLVSRMRAQGRSRLARAVVLMVCVANPVTLLAMEVGHPEEILGGCMCAAAVLLAAHRGGRDYSLLAGVLLGLAIANKEWALLAVGPVLLAVPPGRRARCLASACVTAGAVLAPLVLSSSGSFVASSHAAATPGANEIFQPWQLWWFFGHHGALVHGLFGAPKPGYRIGPAWTGVISHPLILATGLALAIVLWLRGARRARLPQQDALLALALVFLLRCLLDTWDANYYTLPFLLALLTWEAGRPSRNPPLLALVASALVWVNFQWLALHASADVEAAVLLAWTLPLTAWLSLRLLAPKRAARGPRPASEARAGDHETTVSALGRLVRTS
jgi:hypothetical protein